MEARDGGEREDQNEEIETDVDGRHGSPVRLGAVTVTCKVRLPEFGDGTTEKNAAEETPAGGEEQAEHERVAEGAHAAMAEDAQVLREDGDFGGVDRQGPEVIVGDDQFGDGHAVDGATVDAYAFVDFDADDDTGCPGENLLEKGHDEPRWLERPVVLFLEYFSFLKRGKIKERKVPPTKAER